VTDFAGCFDEFRVSAFRLETLRQYAIPVEDERIAAFREHRPLPERSVRTSPWLRRIADTTAAGKRWSRVHVVDEPLSEYVRFEMVTYRESAQAGESIRITGRRADPALDALQTDFWLFDAETDQPFAAILQYDPDGHYIGARVTNDSAAIRTCKAARDLALSHSVPLTVYLADKEIEAA
jgi:hypothetical protein